MYTRYYHICKAKAYIYIYIYIYIYCIHKYIHTHTHSHIYVHATWQRKRVILSECNSYCICDTSGMVFLNLHSVICSILYQITVIYQIYVPCHISFTMSHIPYYVTHSVPCAISCIICYIQHLVVYVTVVNK